jgi:hypothetical protein
MRYTADDIATVVQYNASAKIFRITDSGRVQWDLRNQDVQYLNSALSKRIDTAEDFAALKKQVRKQIVA